MLGVALALMVALGACGGGGTSTSAKQATPTSTEPTTTTTTVLSTTTTTAPPPPPFALAPTPAPGLVQLAIAGPTHTDSYKRSLFGDWQDVDHDCQDTRAEVLIAESAAPITMKPGTCTVASGQWTDPWSGQVTTDGRALDVDHDVPLANAWRSGAWAWDSTRLHAYANDVADADHLNAILLGENRSKGDGGPEQWKPPAPASWCHYALAWDHVKATWGLTATPAEWSALVAMAATC